MNTIKKIQESFKDNKLFLQALTHRSWVNEHREKRGTNERLEFLGDAILEYVVSKEIFSKFPKKEEGYLTALRANLVNTVNLSRVAKELNLGSELFLSKGEEDGGGRENDSLLADTMEAIVGAIFVDQGLKMASKFIEANILKDVEKISKSPLKDSKSAFQEEVQAMGKSTPKYKVVKESGPDHSKTFLVNVLVDSKVFSTGKGKSKNDGSQDAARNALIKLEKERK